jgi:hypothetical protein
MIWLAWFMLALESQRWAGGEGPCLRRVQHPPKRRHHRRRRFRAWLLSGSRTPGLLPQVEVYRRRANGEVLKESYVLSLKPMIAQDGIRAEIRGEDGPRTKEA